MPKTPNMLNEIYEIQNVKGCLFLNHGGDVVHCQFKSSLENDPQSIHWKPLINALGDLREMDILFDNARIYIRKTNKGYLLVLMELFAVIALIKLQCEVLAAKLDAHKPRGIKRFFKK